MSHLEEKNFANREDYIQCQKDLIQKGLYGGLPCEDDIIRKGGEGSKGGKIIGHTKTGKPIYDSASHSAHKNFTVDEHREAAGKHLDKKDSSTKESDRDSHEFQAKEHEAAAKEKKSKGEVGKDTMKNSPATSKEDETWNKFKDNTRKHFEGGDKKSTKHKVGDSVIDKEGNRGKVTHSSDDEISVDYDKSSKEGVDSASYKHHEVNKVEKAEGDNFDGTFDKAMTAKAGEGVTQKESVEHDPKDMQNPKASDLRKAYEVLGLGDLIEKAEGSRGGKVVGHTKSGKAIYENLKGQHKLYNNFTAKDHFDAADLHDKLGSGGIDKTRTDFVASKIGNTHAAAANLMDDSEMPIEESPIKINDDGSYFIKHNGTTYKMKSGESKKDFIKRAQIAIKKDHNEDIKITG
jgi:hypothetical protein